MRPRRRARWRLLLLVAAVAAAAIAGGAWWWRASRGGPPDRDEAAEPSRPRRPPRQWGQVRVSTSPPGAEIFLDGEATGRLTPDLFAVEARVTHELRLVLADHEPVEIDLRLEPGEVREITVELGPAGP